MEENFIEVIDNFLSGIDKKKNNNKFDKNIFYDLAYGDYKNRPWKKSLDHSNESLWSEKARLIYHTLIQYRTFLSCLPKPEGDNENLLIEWLHQKCDPDNFLFINNIGNDKKWADYIVSCFQSFFKILFRTSDNKYHLYIQLECLFCFYDKIVFMKELPIYIYSKLDFVMTKILLAVQQEQIDIFEDVFIKNFKKAAIREGTGKTEDKNLKIIKSALIELGKLDKVLNGENLVKTRLVEDINNVAKLKDRPGDKRSGLKAEEPQRYSRNTIIKYLEKIKDGE